MNPRTRFASFAAMLLIGVAFLSSCAVGPEPDSPAASQPPTAAQSRAASQPLSAPQSRAASQSPSPAPPGLLALPSAIVTADSVTGPDIEPLAEDEELWIIARGSSAGHSPGAMGAPRMARARSALGFAGEASVPGMTRSMERARAEDATADREPDMDPGTGAMTVSGMAGESRRTVTARAHPDSEAGRSIAKVWARSKIADLADRQIAGGDPDGELRDAITRVALRHQLASSYTSFIAVDSSRRTEGSHGVTVHQAVPVPEGVRYDTTVQKRREDPDSEE